MKNHTKKFSSTNNVTTFDELKLKPLAHAIFAWARKPTAWSLAIGAMPALALAQPTGGNVVAGSATISTPNANHTVIQQGSNKAIINWQGFSIGEQGYVQFIQPGRNSVTLNRVIGTDPSSILGHLSATGQVFLVNPNGVFFGANATVDVAGIVATTLDINNDDFMRGDYRFFRSANAPERATIINNGNLNANGGYVVLAGDYVANKGVVQAQLGTALLASGEALTLQLAGSSLINYQVDKATIAHLAGVENTGQILANGGRVIMTADVANDLASTVVNNSGLIQAQSTVEKDGAVYFSGQGGDVANGGTIDASAQAGANGGHVDIRASGDINHEAGSLINVSGADTGNSDAGSVYTWADGTNRFKAGAAIVGKGGAEGGNGAAIELSGNAVQIAGDVNLRATHGKGGSILLDPLNISIVDQDNTGAGGSTVGELWIEGQLQGGTDVTILANGGDGASITVADLSDGVLDGTNGVTHNGGSLTLNASGANSSISFVDKTDTIKVDRNLTLSADDGVMGSGDSYGHTGTTIDVGNLIAGQGNPSGGGLNNNTTWESSLTLDAGSIQTRNLTLGGAIASDTNSVYNLAAHAYAGDLAITGDVTVDVNNTSAAGVKTNTSLQADGGDVTVSGNVTSNATGKGYYHYTWNTTNDGCGGADATSCYSTYADRSQPWKKIGEGDHAIGTTLLIQANSGNVNITGTTDVRATDTNSDFAGNGGVWKTDTNTSKIFWRPTAPISTATINAGGNVDLGNTISVKTDGYAVASYGETESWNDMIAERLLLNGVTHNWEEQVWVPGTDGEPGSYQWVPKSDTDNNVWQGAYTGKYVWDQSWTTFVQGQSGHSGGSESHYDFNSTAMSYDAGGMKATLDLSAGGNVTLHGLDVTSTNRSTTGSGSFNSTYWGHQDSSNVNADLPSAVREVNYSDNFDTDFKAATSTATVNIAAGDNQSVTLNGGDGVKYDVIASHPNLTASSNTLATAGMTIIAGATGENASGAGLVTLNGPIHVEGADDASINLTVVNHDGGIVQAPDGASILVKNNYNGDDAQASFTSDVGNVTLDDIAVEAGRSAYLKASANQNLTLNGDVSATASNLADIDLDSAQAITTSGAVTATANDGTANVKMAGVTGVSTNAVTAIGPVKAWIDLGSSGADVTTNGALLAESQGASGVADIDISGETGATINNTVTAKAIGYDTSYDYLNSRYYISSGGTATIDITGANGDVALKGNLSADAHKTATINVQATNTALTLDAGKQIEAKTASVGGLTSVLGYASNINLTGKTGATSDDKGIKLDGTVTASAARGAASVDVTSTGGDLALNNTVTGSGRSATVDVNSAGTLTQEKAVSATATAGDASVTYTSIGLTEIKDNLVANATSGTAKVDVTGVGVTQVSDPLVSAKTIQATGATAITSVKAGTGALDLDGMTRADATTGTAGVTITGASGSVYDLSAISNDNTATASVETTTDALTLGHSATVAGDNASATGAQLTLTGATSLETRGATVNVTNYNVGNAAGAKATLTASSSTADLGSTTVSTAGTGAASLTAQGSDLTTADSLSATGNNGSASIVLTSTGDMNLGHDVTATGKNGATITATTTTGALSQTTGTILATTDAGTAETTLTSGNAMTVEGNVYATAANGNASASLLSHAASAEDNDADALTINGKLTATSVNGTATASVTADGGSNASIVQGEGSIVQATGGTALTTVDSGDGALALGGMTRADATSGTADVAIAGASGSVYELSVISTGNTATGSVETSTGALTLDHGATVKGYKENGIGAQLTLTGATNLDTSGATVDVTNNHDSDNAVANATLAASSGINTLGTTMVSTAGKGTAELEARATGDLFTVGELTAKGHQFTGDNPQTSGNATVSLRSSSGNVNLANNVTAKGNTNATVSVTADTGKVKQTAGLVLAQIDRGHEAKVEFLSGGKMTVDGTVQSIATNGRATVGLSSSAAPTEDDALVIAGNIGADSLDGDASVLVNTTGGDQASIALEASGSIGASGGASSTITILAGTDDAGTMNSGNTAALKLDGRLSAGLDDADPQYYRGGAAQVTVAGKSGSISQFTVFSGDTANVDVTAYNGDLTLGAGNVIGQGEAKLTASASGELTVTGDLSAALESTVNLMGCFTSCEPEPGLAQIALTSTSGKVVTNGGSELTADGVDSGNAEILVTGKTGIDLQGALSASGNSGAATVILTSASGDISFGNDVTASGGTSAAISATATTGALNQTAGTILATTATGTGNAATTLTSGNAMKVDGTVSATAASGNASASLISNAVPEAPGDGAEPNDALIINGHLIASANGEANASVVTTGGSTASITQGSGSIIQAMGEAKSDVTVLAGTGDDMNAENAAAFTLSGTLHAGYDGEADARGTAKLIVEGKSGQINAFAVHSNNSTASAIVNAYNGDLTVTGNEEGMDAVSATGNAIANLSATGVMTLGDDSHGLSASTRGSNESRATITASGSTVNVNGKLAATATAGVANIDLASYSSEGSVALNKDVIVVGGIEGTVSARSDGTLTQAAGTTVRAGATDGSATVRFTSGGPMTINGDIVAAATENGDLTKFVDDVEVASNHTGYANVSLRTTGGVGADITQGANSSMAAVGASANMEIVAGQNDMVGFMPTFEDPAAIFNLNGLLAVVDDAGGSSLTVQGASGSVHDFIVNAENAGASATITTYGGGLTFNGNGEVTSANGDASLTAKANGSTTASSITQLASTSISAKSTGESGNALVDIQAGDCCQANANLNGLVEALVNASGDATVAVRANNVSVKNATVNVGGSGDALLNVAAPSSIAVTGTLNVQAADAEHSADIKLVSDKLTYTGGKAVLSKGNGHVQLAAFDTRRLIGVDSSSDFDATIQTNYSAATLNKFVGNQAEITFGGEYDRSAWTTGSPEAACLPGMASWKSQTQQTADIHVAGNGHLDLGDAKMVFDTTGTTYYHDLNMSPWSVPAGRLAVFVARPNNIDRYLDRTNNAIQKLNETVEESFNNTNSAATEGTALIKGASPISEKLFLEGDGVNLVNAELKGQGRSSGSTESGDGTQESIQEEERRLQRDSV